MKRTVMRRSGAILPFAVILIVVLLGAVAFAIDLGILALAKTQIQVAADAGALAGALAIPDGPAGAKLLAQQSAQANTVRKSNVVLIPEQDIEMGHWDEKKHQFTPLAGLNESRANSVRVTCRCLASRGTAVPLFFGKIFGSDSSDTSAQAIARRRVTCGVFVGIESADLNGNGAYTDSYNSNFGPYASQTPGDNGHLCSNGPIDVQNGNVNGNAIAGAGEHVSIGPQGAVSGSLESREKPLSIPPVKLGDVAMFNDNGNLHQPPYNSAKKEFKHNGEGYHLQSGTYYFTDLSINGGPIVVSGPVTIYVKGNVSLGGASILNTTNSPANLKIFATGKSVKVHGSSDFSGLIYAPESDVEVTGSAAFYGGAIGKTLKFHNDGGIHADEGLELLAEMPARPRLVD